MTGFLARLWLALHSTPEQVEAFRASNPVDLTTESASANMNAAWGASLIAGPLDEYKDTDWPVYVDPYMLLYIAWHESRYKSNTVTKEPRGKVSCGALTPVPMARCHRQTLLEQYIAGARHLKVWYDVCFHKSVSAHMDSGMHDRCAVLGYAGGFSLIKVCSHRGRLFRRRGGRRVDLCATADLYRGGADDLRGVIGKDVR